MEVETVNPSKSKKFPSIVEQVGHPRSLKTGKDEVYITKAEGSQKDNADPHG